MSNEKTTTSAAAIDPVAPVAQGGARAAATEKPKKTAEIVSLEIDTDDDLGGDPYNHTGSFCVPEFDD